MNHDKPRAPMTWMQRLKRVFAIDIETCPECGEKLRVVACIGVQNLGSQADDEIPSLS